jgi:hypothetical protein
MEWRGKRISFRNLIGERSEIAIERGNDFTFKLSSVAASRRIVVGDKSRENVLDSRTSVLIFLSSSA